MLFNIHIVKLLFLYIQNICFNIVSKVSACLILVECFMNTRVNSMIEFLPVDVTSTCCSIIGISLNKVKRVRGFFFRKICYLQITLSWADLIGSSTWVNVMTGGEGWYFYDYCVEIMTIAVFAVFWKFWFWQYFKLPYDFKVLFLLCEQSRMKYMTVCLLIER